MVQGYRSNQAARITEHEIATTADATISIFARRIALAL
jgi:hypothetical protein